MENAYQVQLKYIDLYSALRYYLWDYDFIQALGKLEISIYKLFPDISEIQRLVNQLYQMYIHYNINNEEISKGFQNLLDLLNDISEIYAPIYQTIEVIPVEDNENQQGFEDTSISEKPRQIFRSKKIY